jgi:hypothetical protein
VNPAWDEYPTRSAIEITRSSVSESSLAAFSSRFFLMNLPRDSPVDALKNFCKCRSENPIAAAIDSALTLSCRCSSISMMMRSIAAVSFETLVMPTC